MMRVLQVASALTFLSGCLAGMVSEEPGWSAADPTRVVCGCHEGSACYQEAASLASARGETAETGERLLYFSQCACFQGSSAGCNTLGHFAKDWTRSCDEGRDVALACTMSGFVRYHGAAVPSPHGRSFKHDLVAAKADFERACAAGSRPACEAAKR